MSRNERPDIHADDATDSKPEINDNEQSSESAIDAAVGDKAGAPMAEEHQTGDADSPGDQTELELAQAEIAKLKDAFLRSKAEEDNVRRRAEKDVSNSRKFAVEGFAKELLNVYDSLKLATTVEISKDADDSVKGVREGVEITLKQLNSAFAKFALKEISPEIGDKLNPNLHQAMSLVESEGAESGSIIAVIQVGFEMHERLLRPAMVVVAK